MENAFNWSTEELESSKKIVSAIDETLRKFTDDDKNIFILCPIITGKIYKNELKGKHGGAVTIKYGGAILGFTDYYGIFNQLDTKKYLHAAFLDIAARFFGDKELMFNDNIIGELSKEKALEEHRRIDVTERLRKKNEEFDRLLRDYNNSKEEWRLEREKLCAEIDKSRR